MKCFCGRSHKGKDDLKRSHDLRLAIQQRDLYRARAIDEVQDHHNVDKVQAAFDVDLEVRRNMPFTTKEA